MRGLTPFMPSLRDIGMWADPVVLSYAAGIECDDWQKQVLRSEHPRIILNCSRQSGKSTTVATRILWEAINIPNSRILIVCPGLRQSSETFEKVLAVYRATGRKVPATSEQITSLRLWNNSRVMSLPGKADTVRGFSAVTLLVLDEGSKIPDELYATLSPMLAVSKGRVIALSTPFGQRGWYHDAWKASIEGKQDWQRFEIPWQQCPRISKAHIDEEREKFGEDWVKQEFECQFLASARSAFRSEDIDAIIDDMEIAYAL